VGPHGVRLDDLDQQRCHVAVHIAALDLGKKLVEELRRLHDAFGMKEQEFTGIIKMGRTHLQDAVPIRLGQEFGAYRRVIGRDIERIRVVGRKLVEVR
jgi:aspartate ammonia-lyase